MDSLKSSTGDAVGDVRAWANDALDMLQRIRSDVCPHLPDLDLDLFLENLVNHLPDVNTVPDLVSDVRSHLPDINISDRVREKIALLRSHLPDLPFQAPLDYIPVLTEHLDSLYTHLSSPQVNFTVPSVTPLLVLDDMLDKVGTSELYLNLKSSGGAVEDVFEKATHDVKIALQRSSNGSKLIKRVHLPSEWRNNPFVHGGYRFIPIDKWPLIILSLFALHNETRKYIIRLLLRSGV
jgi:adiponectin receptor